MDDKARLSFQREQGIRPFYTRFRRQHANFLAHVETLDQIVSAHDRAQYVSLLLNRLMFLYFIQKKGFLDGDTGYLSHRLQMMQKSSSSACFYEHFLLRLFHEGLKQTQLNVELQTLLGNIPYLAHNLFTVQTVECAPLAFQIPDAAFQHIFAFFDTYQWHMHEPAFRNGNEITPDILGYIFEQYVNEQQMGAYYTQKDVTTYIAKNTIIPYLFSAIAATTFDNCGVWQRLQAYPDRYIYPALRCEEPLPSETSADYIRRRTHYTELCAKISNGTISSIDDLITHNLDISQFAHDAIHTITDPDLLYSCYTCLEQIAILDPTCGSGAFLLAALNVLAPLYTACLDHMQTMPHIPAFQDIAARMSQQGNLHLSIFKIIITNNLYGVDIMEDAIEICKLRLFLKLISLAEQVADIVPLPVIDQHLQVGNILAPLLPIPAYASLEQMSTPPHWLVVFEPVIKNGGFHVIIGNPPYVEYIEKLFPYQLRDFVTLPCANLYPCVVERSRHLLSPLGRHGMILPLAAFATRNMQPFIDAFQYWFPCSWLSFYHFRPAMLFSGGKVASIPTAIYLAKVEGTPQRFSTHLNKWPHAQRPFLFSRLSYCQITTPHDPENPHYYPKFGHARENAIMEKLLKQQSIRQYLAPTLNQNTLFYRSAGGLYWKVFVNFPWPYEVTSNKVCSFLPAYDRDVFVALLNSSLFWWYYTVTFDTFNLKNYMLFGFRFSYPEDSQIVHMLQKYCQLLMDDYRKHARHLKRSETDSYTIYARKSKPIIDAIDRILALHYGFTPEELHFIMNYDIAFRMGKEQNESSLFT